MMHLADGGVFGAQQPVAPPQVRDISHQHHGSRDFSGTREQGDAPQLDHHGHPAIISSHRRCGYHLLHPQAPTPGPSRWAFRFASCRLGGVPRVRHQTGVHAQFGKRMSLRIHRDPESIESGRGIGRCVVDTPLRIDNQHTIANAWHLGLVNVV